MTLNTAILGCTLCAQLVLLKQTKDAIHQWLQCRMIYMVIITEMRELAEAMDAEGKPKPHAVYQRPDGQWVADVFPLG